MFCCCLVHNFSHCRNKLSPSPPVRVGIVLLFLTCWTVLQSIGPSAIVHVYLSCHFFIRHMFLFHSFVLAFIEDRADGVCSCHLCKIYCRTCVYLPFLSFLRAWSHLKWQNLPKVLTLQCLYRLSTLEASRILMVLIY